MRWLLLLRRRGVSVGARDFARVGLPLTPLLLLSGALAIALTL